MGEDVTVMTGLVYTTIDASSCLSSVSRTDCGAVSLFLGTTRDTNSGKRVSRLSYEAYEPMASKQLREIALSAVRKWELKAVVVLHRLGDVPVGECSVIIVCASPHRQAAMCASSEIIERIKEILTVWKREVYEDGTAEWRANREWLYSSPSSNI